MVPKNYTLLSKRIFKADFAGCRTDKWCISGKRYFLGPLLYHGIARKEKANIAFLEREAEYIATGCYCAQIVWIKKTLELFWTTFEMF